MTSFQALFCLKRFLSLFAEYKFNLLRFLKIKDLIWPDINQKYLIEENVNIVVQINGKKRGVMSVEKDISEENLVKDLVKSKTFDKFLKGNKIKKQFFVKNRLINFLI